MKYKTLFGAAALLVLSISPVNAMVEPSDLVLGGLTPGESVQDVLDIYGPAETYKAPHLPYCDGIMVYGKNFMVSFDCGQKDPDSPAEATILEIAVSADNGVTTAKGIHVGSSGVDVTAAYGKPDQVGAWGKGQRYDYYTGSDIQKAPHLVFILDNNVVTSITAGVATGE